MNPLTRGVRNAFRNGLRTLALVVILGLSLGLAMCMLIARSAVEDKVTSLKQSVGTTISVAPAGMRGSEGGGAPLTTDAVAGLDKLEHVTGSVMTLSDRLQADETSLKSSIEPGAMLRRGQASAAPTNSAPRRNAGQPDRPITVPVRVTGTSDASRAGTFGGQTLTWSSGGPINPAADVNEAMIGTALATKNNLTVGSTFTAYNATLTVKGIFDSGQQFANDAVVVGLPTLQRLTEQPKTLSSLTLTVDSADHLSGVTDAVKAKVGTAGDVANSQETADAILAPLGGVTTVATYSLIAALAAGALTIVLTMVMIVRERRREIGVMKAVGTSGRSIVAQFMVESVTLTLLGLVLGLGLATVAAAPLTNALVASSTGSADPAATQRGPGGNGPGRQSFRNGPGGVRGLGNAANAAVRTVRGTLTPTTAAYGVGAALLLAMLGSAVPAIVASRIRPSETMRAD